MNLIVIVGAGAVALLSLAVSLSMIVFSDTAFNTRLARQAQVTSVSVRTTAVGARLYRALERIGEVAGRGGLEGPARASLRAKLTRAGFYGERSVEAFHAIRVVSALGFGLVALLVMLVIPTSSPQVTVLAGMSAVAAGLYLPNLLLRVRIGQRAKALLHGLPDAVDLMVVCLEAGGTLTSAMQRVESEFRDLHPVLAEQLAVALLEMQAGASRASALQRLADRSGVEEVQALVMMLVQSEALGASVGQTMRVFAQQSREARYLDAERRAAELPVKMAFPLVLFIFPAMMTVIFTPIVIRISRTLFHVGHG
jgi:tight adherence protein C